MKYVGLFSVGEGTRRIICLTFFIKIFDILSNVISSHNKSIKNKGDDEFGSDKGCDGM
ncbi:hypothetical protein QFZ81_003978 [Paenibacillus sp. V4I9]|nr:hypothetical protein [Paenibacillus sp. V4I9]